MALSSGMNILYSLVAMYIVALIGLIKFDSFYGILFSFIILTLITYITLYMFNPDY